MKIHQLASSQGGFSLLEAIVALMLVTMLSMTAFAWINNLLLSVTKIESNAYDNYLERNVTEFLSDINVMLRPTGSQAFATLTISWNAELVEPIKRGKNMSGGATPFELGLYNVVVTVVNDENDPVTFNMIKVGYRSLPDSTF